MYHFSGLNEQVEQDLNVGRRMIQEILSEIL